MNLEILNLRWDLMGPELIVAVTALLVLTIDTFVKGPDEDRRSQQTWLAALGCLAAAAYGEVVLGGMLETELTFGGLFAVDAFSLFFKEIILISASLCILLCDRWLGNHRLTSGGFYALLLFSVLGMMYMISAADLVMLFLGLEIMSIPIYVLASSERRNIRAVESGLKYLILGSLATCVLLFGTSLLYGYSGLLGTPTTSILTLRALLADGGTLPTYALAGGVLLLIGMAFKVSAVPFHMWTPDVYEGAPTPITAFMSVAVKATAFAALLRVFGGGLLDTLHLHTLLWVIAALTMVVGNAAALAQSSIKRMLAYSSIAHAGYILLGLLAGSRDGLAGILFYALGYAVMNVAAFGVLVYWSERGTDAETFEDVKGLGTRYPLAGAILTLSMLSLMGMPPLVGFWGKFYVFRAVILSDFPGHLFLAVLGVLMSAVSAFYYLKVIVVTFMADPSQEVRPHQPNTTSLVGTLVAGLLIVGLGLAPSAYMAIADRSVGIFFPLPSTAEAGLPPAAPPASP